MESKIIKNEIAVVVPIYKEEISQFEQIALDQCFAILYEYPIVFVISKKMKNGIFHKKYFNVAQFIFLENSHLESIKSYNYLMLSEWFYEFFLSFKYILIYQLDCFVFKDDLLDWARKGYSYVGAPWLFDDLNNCNKKNNNFVGNGGFSLRNVGDCIKILESSKKVFSFNEYIVGLKESQKSLVYLRALKYLIVKCTKLNYSFRTIRRYTFINEDEVFAMACSRFEFFKIPEPLVALSFAFEKEPEKSFQLNGQSLPFGCHAWLKYGNNFYRPIFKQFGFEL